MDKYFCLCIFAAITVEYNKFELIFRCSVYVQNTQIMVKSKKTRAEIQRAYRERLKEKGAEVAQKERRRWHAVARRQLKKVKVIADLSEREKSAVRRKWRTTKAEYRRIQRNYKSSTPPVSGRTSLVGAQRGRPKFPYHRRKAYVTISKLNAALESVEAKSHKYKMKWLRLKHASDKRTEQYDNSAPNVSHLNANTPSKSSPRFKTRSAATCDYATREKSLLFHNVMAQQIGNARKSRVSQKVPYSVPQQILKKYRLANFARKVGYTVSASTKVNKQLGRGHANALDDATKNLVQEFFERDDNSRLTSGKKQTMTKNKIEKLRRLLLDTVIISMKRSVPSTHQIAYHILPLQGCVHFGYGCPLPKTETRVCARSTQMFSC